MLARLAALAALAAPALAAWSVTFPTNSSGWTSSYGPNAITWTADTTESFTVLVINPKMPETSLEVAHYLGFGAGTFYFSSVQALEADSGYKIEIQAANGTTIATSDEFGVTSS